MPRTIYSTTGAFPVALEGTKRVKTFPSGLVLVSQDYAVPRGQEANYAATFAVGQPLEVDSPAIDGLYIFPEPEWIDSGDGFTRLTVSAYGRFDSTGNKTLTKTLQLQKAYWSIAGFNGSPATNYSQTFLSIADQMVWQFILPKTSAPNVSTSDQLKIYRLNGQQVNPLLVTEFFNTAGHRVVSGAGSSTLSLSVSNKITRAECTNFGSFDEWTVVYDAVFEPTDFNFGEWLLIGAPTNEYKPFSQTFGAFSTIGGLYSGIDQNNSANVQILKVENINAPGGSWSLSTPRQEMAINGTTSTYIGGTFTSNATTKTATYSPPSVTPPSRVPIRLLGNLPAPAPYTSGAFTWNAQLVGTNSDSEGNYKIYEYRLVGAPVFENFEVTLSNELSQSTKYSVTIAFIDPPLITPQS